MKKAPLPEGRDAAAREGEGTRAGAYLLAARGLRLAVALVALAGVAGLTDSCGTLSFVGLTGSLQLFAGHGPVVVGVDRRETIGEAGSCDFRRRQAPVTVGVAGLEALALALALALAFAFAFALALAFAFALALGEFGAARLAVGVGVDLGEARGEPRPLGFGGGDAPVAVGVERLHDLAGAGGGPSLASLGRVASVEEEQGEGKEDGL